MRRDRQGIELVPHEQGAGQMDRIERTDNRRERISRPLENRCPERHQGEAFDRLQGCGTAVGYLVIVKAEAKPRAIDRPKALKPDEFARHGGRDLRPDPETTWLPQHDAEKDR